MPSSARAGEPHRPGQPAGLLVDGLTVRLGHAGSGRGVVDAVREVSLEVPAGQVMAIVGPSGCGKSTLLRAVAGLEEPAAGRIALDGRDLRGVPVHRRGVALMFQDGQLFDHLSVAGNVAYAPRLRGAARAQRQARAAELLELVGLPGYGHRRPASLSGGEQQRVALARALAAGPRLLLLDEPLSALDRALRERLAADLRQVLTETGTTALLVTHDHDEAFAVADSTGLMRAGRLVQTGATAAVWRHPVDEEAARFLGHSVLPDPGDPSGRRLLAARRSAVVIVPLDGAGGAAATVETEGDGAVLRVGQGRVLRVVPGPDAVHVRARLERPGGGALVVDGEAPAGAVPEPGALAEVRVARRSAVNIGEGV